MYKVVGELHPNGRQMALPGAQGAGLVASQRLRKPIVAAGRREGSALSESGALDSWEPESTPGKRCQQGSESWHWEMSGPALRMGWGRVVGGWCSRRESLPTRGGSQVAESRRWRRGGWVT